ncbi:MAG: cytochrome C oxidase assembly protein, partial [Acidithiobacillus sp.]
MTGKIGVSAAVSQIPHAIEGEMTRVVRVVGGLITGMLLAAVLAGLWRGVTSQQGLLTDVINGLKASEVGFAIVLILLGSLVEGFGYGLSLGTRWPYTRNIAVLMVRGDPEAAHRMVATLVGLVALALVILSPSVTTISGLSLIVVTALFGMGTLYVLAGRAPA